MHLGKIKTELTFLDYCQNKTGGSEAATGFLFLEGLVQLKNSQEIILSDSTLLDRISKYSPDVSPTNLIPRSGKYYVLEIGGLQTCNFGGRFINRNGLLQKYLLMRSKQA